MSSLPHRRRRVVATVVAGLSALIVAGPPARASVARGGRPCVRSEIGTVRRSGSVMLRCVRRAGHDLWTVGPASGTSATAIPSIAIPSTAIPAATRPAAPRLAAASLPLSTAPSLSVTNGPQTVRFGGLDRRYVVHRPPGLTPGGPLVVVLHGGLGGAEQAESAYGWNDVADRESFTVVYPEGTDVAIGHAWNAGSCCGPPAAGGVDDVGFVTAVIDGFVAARVADPRRIYATGISNGAMLAYRLACEQGGRFAAIGPVSGTITSTCPTPPPVPVLHIHGLADGNVPFGGSASTKGTNIGTVRTAVPEVMRRFRAAAACPAPTVTTTGPVTRSSAACPGGVDVVLIAIDGAGHQWPGSTVEPSPAALRLGVDPPSKVLNATNVLWDFFRAHSL